MSSEYTLQILRVVVAQICQTIGWHSIQSTPLEILVDILHRYLQEITRATYRYTEFYGRIQPNLDDLSLAFRDLGINTSDIEEYINYVDPVPCAVDVPKYPVRRDASLNFLKPGSKEVLTRPVHINEYLPPIFPEKEVDENIPDTNDITSDINNDVNINSISEGVFKKPEITETPMIKPKSRILFEEEGRPAREITSVMMTSSGFISPAREGKLPDTNEPIIPKQPPIVTKPSSPAQTSATSIPAFGGGGSDKFEKKPKKKLPEKDKKRSGGDLSKHLKPSKSNIFDNHHQSSLDGTKLFKKFKGKQKNKNHDEQQQHSLSANKTNHGLFNNDTFIENDELSSMELKTMTMNNVDLEDFKLSSVPDKQKLHIFKKLSSSKKERDDTNKSPNNNIFMTDNKPQIADDQSLGNLVKNEIHDHDSNNKHNMISNIPPSGINSTDFTDVGLDSTDLTTKQQQLQNQYKIQSQQLSNMAMQLNYQNSQRVRGQKRPRKQRQSDMMMPLNLSNEKVPVLSKHIDRSPFMVHHMMQEKVKEKKERKKPKIKENRKQNLFALPLVMRDHDHKSSVFGNTAGNNAITKDDLLFTPDKTTTSITPSSTPSSSANMKIDPNMKITPSLLSQNFGTIPSLSLFPYYPFPTRPGLIPSPSLFSQMPPLSSDNSAFKYLSSMMRFPNPLNPGEKVPRLAGNFKDIEPLPLAPPPLPADMDIAYCNVAPLVPDSMKITLSPTHHRSSTSSSKIKNLPSSSSSIVDNNINEPINKSTTITPIPSILPQNLHLPIKPQYMEPPIEISDDEKRKSDSDDNKGNEPKPKSPSASSGGFYVINNNSNINFNTNKAMNSFMNNNASNPNPSMSGTNSNSNVIHNQNNNIFMRNSHTNDNCNNNNFVQKSDVAIKNDDNMTFAPVANEGGKDKESKLARRKEKEHKKGKRGKDGKIKKKKDKKDKSKSKDKAEKRKEREEKRDKDKTKKLKKDKKKEKRNLLTTNNPTDDDPKPSASDMNDAIPKLTLKLGFGNSPQPQPQSQSLLQLQSKLQSLQQQGSPDSRKTSFKSHHNNDDGRDESYDETTLLRTIGDYHQRESSPELARISPLVTRPPKQKPTTSDIMNQNNYMHLHSGNIENKYINSISAAAQGEGNTNNLIINSPTKLSRSISPSNQSNVNVTSNINNNNNNNHMMMNNNYNMDKTPMQMQLSSSSSSSSSSTTIIPQQYQQSSSVVPLILHSMSDRTTTASTFLNNVPTCHDTVIQTDTIQMSSSTSNQASNNNRPSSYIDAEGNQVWICPACGRVDDGTPMIGCDGCDAWYHWVCVGIQVPPDDKEDWYCRVCIAKKQEAQGSDKKRKRKKKNKTN